MIILAEYWNVMQEGLIPYLSGCLNEPLTDKLEQVVRILEVVRVETHVRSPFGTHSGGRRMLDRRCFGRAFVIKAVYDFPTTECLIEVLRHHRILRAFCGWECRLDVPSSSSFSRAFAEFAEEKLGDRVHAAMVKEHVGEQTVLHQSVDATEVVARERPAKKTSRVPEVTVKRKPGRPQKGEVVPPKEVNRMDVQLAQTVEEALRDLPKVCDWGSKLDSGGHKHSWKGYKTSIVWSDGAFPLTVATTSASVHDSQMAIPLIRQTAERVAGCYVLGDKAYDAPQIRQAIAEVGCRAIIDPNPRRGGVPEDKLFDPATTLRYNERTTAERGNSRLKDGFGLRHVWVRGNHKVHSHVMFGIVALFADQLLKPFVT
jgi:hypothetical protein